MLIGPKFDKECSNRCRILNFGIRSTVSAVDLDNAVFFEMRNVLYGKYSMVQNLE